MKELLREEETGDAVGVGRPEGEVLVVDVEHVGGGEHAVLLGCEVEDKGRGCLKGSGQYFCQMKFTLMKGSDGSCRVMWISKKRMRDIQAIWQ